MEIPKQQKIEDLSRFLQTDDKPHSPGWLRDFFRRQYGYDIGPYPEVLGELEGLGKIKSFGHDQWNSEREEFDWICENVQWKQDCFGVVPGEPEEMATRY